MQVSLSGYLVRCLDSLVRGGWYKSRTEAIEDAIRHLILRFRSVSGPGRLVMYRVEGRLRDIDPLSVVADQSIRDDLRKAFGSDSVDEVMRIVRRI